MRVTSSVRKPRRRTLSWLKSGGSEYRSEKSLAAQYLLHGLAFGELVNELVHVSDVLHQRVLDVLHLVSANAPGDK